MTEYKKEPTYKNRTSSINIREYPIENFSIKDLLTPTHFISLDNEIKEK